MYYANTTDNNDNYRCVYMYINMYIYIYIYICIFVFADFAHSGRCPRCGERGILVSSRGHYLKTTFWLEDHPEWATP